MKAKLIVVIFGKKWSIARGLEVDENLRSRKGPIIDQLQQLHVKGRNHYPYLAQDR